MAHPKGLLSLPDELLLDIADFVQHQRDLARILRVNRRLHAVLRNVALRRNIMYYNSSAMMWAVEHNRVEVVGHMMRLKAGLGFARHERGPSDVIKTPLDCAVTKGNLRLVQMLTGEDPEKIKDIIEGEDLRRKYIKPLRLALYNRDESIIHVLVNRTSMFNRIIAVDAITHERKTALHLACDKRLVETVRLLLSKGADPNWHSKNWRPSFRYVERLLIIDDVYQHLLNGDALEILQLLFTHDLEPNEDLHRIGSEHSDPSVRWMFHREALCASQEQSTARESSAFQIDHNALFSPLVGAHTQKDVTHGLSNVCITRRDPEHEHSLLSVSPDATQICEVPELELLAAYVDPFPPLGS
ncbi:hypothetical protein P153DRAFT_400411 [Dothidotthia symphoricarpi CBS 119687]|uniref:F-box domain-containing protein n=1 Tax=Dothidotthia symphoricarpi CBS 119687 TaxID=1392245 RepID=A0A6A6A126_9PLEO|nr:uncharacterized protein P153DRAFT_400411 [Dothidotthia symphoricarpi CBS 119687]KAF2124905.1 hypothetical protein P153DRAFT_400411 [Dothidotthia symphoricarpi CBS 119687]